MSSLSPSVWPWLGRAARFLLRRNTRLILCGIAFLVCTSIAVYYAITCYDDPHRRDGNYGHAAIDFGGQWLMGRMLVTGNGWQLYNRLAQRRVLEAAYPRVDSEDPAPDPDHETKPDPGDAENLLSWMMGDDNPATTKISGYLAPLAAANSVDATPLFVADPEQWKPIGPVLGGPLYPPINAYLFAPLGLLSPRPAYRTMQAFNLILTFAIAWLAYRLTDGRIWWSVAVILLMGFPGYSGALNLGQNALLSLFLLMLGWRQLQLGRPYIAGIAWGLLAFKPVWVVAFLLVPLWTRRWRMAGAMVVTGIVLAAVTLPVVGWHSWLDWLNIGSRASEIYAYCKTWIFLSRDLLGIPRRYLLTFSEGGYAASDDPYASLATSLGLGLWLTPLTITTAAVYRRGRQVSVATRGPHATFVLLGGWMACYHFMYYDSLLAALPCCLLFNEPRRLCRSVIRGRVGTWRGFARSAVATILLISVSAFTYFSNIPDPIYHFPWDTLFLALLWLWCDVARGQGSADVYGYKVKKTMYFSLAQAFRPGNHAREILSRALALCGFDKGLKP